MDRPALDERTVKRNRLIAVAIMLLPVLVLGTASLLWLAVKSGKIDVVGSLGTHNKGALIDPVREFESIAVIDLKGEPFIYTQQPGRWTLVIPGSASCGDDCRQTLWLTRQLHTALGRRATYLRRMYLSDGLPLDSEFATFLAEEHPEIQVLGTTTADIDSLLGSLPSGRSPLTDNLYYLVDKGGFVMMVYGPEHSGKEVISDLKFLMKQVGDE